MSSPSPVVINFVCRGVNDTLKAIKSITDAVNGTERKSTAVAQAGASERTKAAQKEAKATAAAAGQTAQMVQAAQRAGTKTVEQELRVRLQNQTKHLNALYDMTVAKQDAITAKSKKNSADVEKTKEAEFRKLEKLTEKWKSGELSAIDSVSKARQKAAAASAGGVARQIEIERGRAKNEMLRGGTPAHPAFSPQARLSALAGAQGKSVEEQKAILDKVMGMREQAHGSRSENKRIQAEHDALEKAKSKKTEAEEKNRLAIRERSALMAGKFAAQQANQEAAAKKKADVEVEEKRKAFNSTVMGSGGRAIRNATATAGIVAGGLFRTATSMGGGFSIDNAIQDRLHLERQASLLSNVAVVPGHETRPDPRNIVAGVRAASTRTGTDANELMAGLHAYVAKSADYAGGMKNLDFFGKVAKSTGSSVDEVMRTAGTLSVQNKELQAGERLGDEGMKKLILSTVMQARQGSVEFADMARAGGKVTRSAGMYVGDQADNQRKLLGLSQIGMRTAGNDVAEAATNLSNLQSDATTHAGAVEALLGHKFKNDKGQIEGGPDKFIGDLMEAAMSKKGGLDQLSNEGGDGKRVFGQRSMKMFQALAPVYNAAEAEALKKGASKEDAQKAGAAAVRSDINKTISTKYDEKDLEKDFAEVMKSSAEQFEAAVRELRMEVGEKLIPELVKLLVPLKQLTPVLVSALQAFTKMATWAANNPLAGLGLALTGAILKEVAAAGLNKALEKAVSSSLGSAAGLSVATAVVSITAATMAIQQMAANENERQGKNVKGTIDAANAMPLLRSGAIKTPEDLANAKRAAEGLKGTIEEEEKAKGGSKLFYGTALFGAGIADAATLGFAGAGKKVREAHSELKQTDQRTIDDQKRTLDAFVKAIEKATASMGKSGGAGPSNPADPSRSLPISRR